MLAKTSGLLLILTISGAAYGQSAVVKSTATYSGRTSVLKIANPDEKVVINGKILPVSEVMKLESSADSLRAQRLHILENRSHAGQEPNAQLQQPNQSGQSREAGLAAHPSGAGTLSTSPDHLTSSQPK